MNNSMKRCFVSPFLADTRSGNNSSNLILVINRCISLKNKFIGKQIIKKKFQQLLSIKGKLYLYRIQIIILLLVHLIELRLQSFGVRKIFLSVPC